MDEIIFLQNKKINSMKTNPSQEINFLGKDIIILPNVFYPATDTELIINTVEIKPEDVVLEPCSGTGIISLFLAEKAKLVVATDINPDAVKNIEVNFKKYNLKNVKVLNADLFPELDIKYDKIVINPPYTDKEAKDVVEKAFWDKEHSVVKKFFREARNYLNKNGTIYLSWANFADFNFIEKLAEDSGYTALILSELEKGNKSYRVYQIN
jgi:HemK-related putative methylase